jgi:hypothetical protein
MTSLMHSYVCLGIALFFVALSAVAASSEVDYSKQ